jgi:hypothetical protein
MPTPRVNGTLQPVAKAPVIEYDPNRGQTIRLEWESAGDNLRNIALSLGAQRIAYNFTQSPHLSRIIASATGSQVGVPEITTDTWQIMANEIQKDIKTLPRFLEMEESYPGTIGYIVRDVELYNQGQSPGTPAPVAGAAAEAANLFWLLVRGVTHFATSQYVLRHTTNVWNGYAANVSDLNIERIYTTTQLLAECQNASSWIFPLPGRLAYKLQQIPAPAARSNYLWGWRKLPSTETTAAGNRIEITTEYWLEQWSTVVYPAVS